MRHSELKPEGDGYYRKNIGFVVRDGKRNQPKISLGTNKRQAQARFELILKIWGRTAKQDRSPVWEEIGLEIAKAIGRGETEYRLSVDPLERDKYVHLVDAAVSSFPEIVVKPADEALYCEQKAAVAKVYADMETAGKALFENAARLRALYRNIEEIGAKALRHSNPTTKGVLPPSLLDLPIGTSLHEALDDYSKHISQVKFDISEGAVNDTGRGKQKMVLLLKSYLSNQPLSMLKDFAALDKLFGILRNRPITHRYGKPMARKSVTNLIGELSQFFEWLDTSPQWDWSQPHNYHKINHRPLPLELDDDAEAGRIPTYSRKQLKTLFECATPLERLLILLGVNCAFGADQIGRLRINEMIEKNGVHYIKRIRRKKKVMGIHRLFPITVAGIRWAIRGREEEKEGHVLLNGNGRPLWRKTTGGNRCADIPNAWYRLLDRVRLDHPDFPRHGFNTLRDTSADMIRQFGEPEVASMHLTHRHQTRDRNLVRYTNPPRKKLFRAQRKLERYLEKVFALPDDPWKAREHQYISLAKIKKIRALADEDAAPTEIARIVGVAKTTVYRWMKPTPAPK